MSRESVIFLNFVLVIISIFYENIATPRNIEKREYFKNYNHNEQNNYVSMSPQLKRQEHQFNDFYEKATSKQPNTNYEKVSYKHYENKSKNDYRAEDLNNDIYNEPGDIKMLEINNFINYKKVFKFHQKSLDNKPVKDVSSLNDLIVKGNHKAVHESLRFKAIKSYELRDDTNHILNAVSNKQWSIVANWIRLGGKITTEMEELASWSELFHKENDMKKAFFNESLQSDEDHFKMLFLSIIKGYYDLTKFFIDCGINLNSLKSGNSHIWLLLSRGNYELVDYMISNGANIKAEDKLGLTLLHKAALLDEQKSILEFLLSKGLDVNIQGKLGLTPLDVANGGAWNYLKEKGGKTLLELKTT